MNDAQRRLLRDLAAACRADEGFLNTLLDNLRLVQRETSNPAQAHKLLGILANMGGPEDPPLAMDQVLAAIDPLDMELASASVLTAVLAIFEGTPPDRPLSPAARAFVAWSLDLVGRRLTAELGART